MYAPVLQYLTLEEATTAEFATIVFRSVSTHPLGISEFEFMFSKPVKVVFRAV